MVSFGSLVKNATMAGEGGLGRQHLMFSLPKGLSYGTRSPFRVSSGCSVEIILHPTCTAGLGNCQFLQEWQNKCNQVSKVKFIEFQVYHYWVIQIFCFVFCRLWARSLLQIPTGHRLGAQFQIRVHSACSPYSNGAWHSVWSSSRGALLPLSDV